jgi:hypothetical protein
MRSFIILVLLVAVVALSVSFYDAGITPAAIVPGSTPAPASVTEAQVFRLMPDGKVEVTDAQVRRVFQWDGMRWLEHDPSVVASARSDTR